MGIIRTYLKNIFTKVIFLNIGLLETLDIMNNVEELRALEESEKEMREGKQISLQDLTHEIEKEKE